MTGQSQSQMGRALERENHGNVERVCVVEIGESSAISLGFSLPLALEQLQLPQSQLVEWRAVLSLMHSMHSCQSCHMHTMVWYSCTYLTFFLFFFSLMSHVSHLCQSCHMHTAVPVRT